MSSPSDDRDVLDGGLVAQLHALYAERERLHRALGTADAEASIALVRSLQAQLVDLHGARAFAPEGVAPTTPKPPVGAPTR